MKSVGVILIAMMSLAMQGCFYHPYFSEEESVWAYFEDWDTDKNANLDKDEFLRGYKNSEMYRKVSGEKSLSEEETAAAMFAKADDNGDNEVTGLEFYRWEVKL